MVYSGVCGPRLRGQITGGTFTARYNIPQRGTARTKKPSASTRLRPNEGLQSENVWSQQRVWVKRADKTGL